MKDFPIPLVALGPGTQTEDQSLDYLPMPKDMDTYRPPVLPEPEELAGRDAARAVLGQVLALLDRTAERGPGGQVSHVVNLTLLPVTPEDIGFLDHHLGTCLLYTSPSPRDKRQSRMPSSA